MAFHCQNHEMIDCLVALIVGDMVLENNRRMLVLMNVFRTPKRIYIFEGSGMYQKVMSPHFWSEGLPIKC